MFAGKLDQVKDEKGNDKLQILVTVNNQTRVWGISWSAAKHISKIIGKDGDAWEGAKVKFNRQPVKTKRGEVLTLLATPISFQPELQQNTRASSTQTENLVSKTKESQVQAGQKAAQTYEVKTCPFCKFYQSTDPKILMEHMAMCPANTQEDLPSARSR